MPLLHDTEFGEVVVRTHRQAARLRATIAPDGRLRITMPSGAPLFAAKLLLRTHRTALRRLIHQRQAEHGYQEDQSIGKSHRLLFRPGTTGTVQREGTTIVVSADHALREQPIVQAAIRQAVLAALRKEAKAHLPHRLSHLAQQHGFYYQAVKFSHASSRWGSCSSKGTISLNIALMQLPFELIDYVLLHELCHTRQMNHSAAFWQELAAVDPAYQRHRQQLRRYTPHL